jgi:hypothetical protein
VAAAPAIHTMTVQAQGVYAAAAAAVSPSMFRRQINADTMTSQTCRIVRAGPIVSLRSSGGGGGGRNTVAKQKQAVGCAGHGGGRLLFGQAGQGAAGGHGGGARSTDGAASPQEALSAHIKRE